MNTQVIRNTSTKTRSKSGTKKLVNIGMLSAIAIILMQFEIPLPFAPVFYKIDFSEVPVLIASFAIGPVAGAAVELVKVILNVAISGTTTAGVGDVANFLIGCGFCVPAGMIYQKMKTRKGAVTGMAVGTAVMTIVGGVLNAFVLLPVYARAFEMPIDALIKMGTEVNPAITNLSTFVLFAVTPFNILKGILVALIVVLIYKKISPVFKISR